MGEKQEIIQKMLEMQKQFIAYEHEHGVEPRDYWAGKEGHPLARYKDDFAKLSSRLVDLAHEEKGSKR